MASIIPTQETLFKSDSVEIRHGDALYIMSQMQPDSFDAVVTDPPYSTGGGSRSMGRKGAQAYVESAGNNEELDFDDGSRDPWNHAEWTKQWMREAYRLVKKGGWLLVFCDWRGIPFVSSAGQMSGWLWQRVLVWDKVNARPFLGNFDNNAEFACAFTKGPLGSFQKYKGRERVDNVVECSLSPAEKFHPTSKPTAVMRHFMKILPAGCSVIDPFCGAGTTLEAAKQLGFAAVGIEITPYYAEIAARRVGCPCPVLTPEKPFLSTSFF